MSSSFVHLHLHTEFSLIDGTVRVKPLMRAAAAADMPAIAITDQGNLFGMVKFYRAAIEAGIKPIIGADLRIAHPTDTTAHHVMTFLCADTQGYSALTRLITASYLDGQASGLPVVSREWLTRWSEGLIVLSGASAGDVGEALVSGDPAQARQRLAFWQELYGDRFYLELQRTGRPGDEQQVHGAVQLAIETGCPVVASNDVRFLEPADHEAHEARVCIHDGRILHDEHRPRRYSEAQYLRSAEEMHACFADIPEAIENTLLIAQRCNLKLTLDQNALPDFPVPDNKPIDQFLREESERGLASRIERDGAVTDAQAYQARLDFELNVINQMGFPGYFLIVADFIRWAKAKDIPVGPGRGSGAGSLVAYALDITDLDPLRYDLLFERFLNPERVSMPDFDVDFCMEKRDQVIDYVAERYGREKVSQIATHGTMAARAVVRDVGRVLGHGYGYVDRIAKMIPFELGMTLEKALAQEEELQKLCDEDDDVQLLINLAKRLEGLSRNVGKHAGGVVIAPSDLTEFAPLFCEPGGAGLATQFDKDDVEAVGLVKFDFLGLRTLTIIDWTVKAVNKIREANQEPPIDINRIPLDDKKTFSLLRDCRTTAIFQLESRGMKDLIRRLRPDHFEDIIALVALFRPGPLQSGMVDDFIDRKHGRKPVAYPTPELHHDALKPILKPTYGVILYQEQVMQIAQAVGGYSLGEADLLRRAMGKKKPEEMAKQRSIFCAGAVAQGLRPAHAEGLFDLMEKFAGYGFNKSHSAAYALLSYQTAWLKAHYPAPFMAAVLSSDMDNTDKVVTLIDECRAMKLAVAPPDVNRSGWMFEASDPTSVVYGLGAVKGVGQSAVESLVVARQSGADFGNLHELCQRIDLKRINRRVLEAFIRSGSVDHITPNRASAMAALPSALQGAEQAMRNESVGQEDLFGLGAAVTDTPDEARLDTVEVLPEWEEMERLSAEKETLGLYLSGHPIGAHEAELGRFITCRLKDAGANTDKRAVVAGLIVDARNRVTQSGRRLGIVTLDDRTARLEMVLFGDVFERFRHLIEKDTLVVVEGEINHDDFSDGYRISAERVYDLASARLAFAQRLVLSIEQAHAQNGLLPKIKQVLAAYQPGSCPVWVEYASAAARAGLRLGEQWRVRPEPELIDQLQGLLAAEAVRVEYGRHKRQAKGSA